MPIDSVKLDASFVRDATSDPDDAALVMAIITLAHNLRLKVIAEGIETEDQFAFLRLLRCDQGQGYFLGKPSEADELFLTFLNRSIDTFETPTREVWSTAFRRNQQDGQGA